MGLSRKELSIMLRVCYLSVSMLKYLLTFYDKRQIIIWSNSSKTVYNTNNCRCCHPNLLLLYSVDKQVWCHAEISVTTEPFFVFAVYPKTTQSLGISICLYFDWSKIRNTSIKIPTIRWRLHFWQIYVLTI